MTLLTLALTRACRWQVAEETFTWSKINALLMTVSIVGFFVFIMIYGELYSASPEFYGVAKATYARDDFWLLLCLSIGICVLLNFSVEYVRREFFPTPIDIMIERERYVVAFPPLPCCAVLV